MSMGLQIYNASGALVLDSNKSYIKIVQKINYVLDKSSYRQSFSIPGFLADGSWAALPLAVDAFNGDIYTGPHSCETFSNGLVTVTSSEGRYNYSTYALYNSYGLLLIMRI